MSSLAEELPKEIARVRGLQDLYKELRSMPNVMVEPQIQMMENTIQGATEAAVQGDVVAMMRYYEELKDYKE